MNNSIVSEGLLTIPLYHGTSSLFLESILLYGLGTVNPLDGLGALSLLNDLVKAADKVFHGNSEWLTGRFSYEWMVNQTITGGKANFQHGNTYLTPSRKTAIEYAASNRLGSELLSICEELWNWIREKEPEVLQVTDKIADIFAGEYRPILITLHDVPVEALLSEQGSPIQDNLRRLEESKEPSYLREFWQQINFRLISPLPKEKLSWEIIDSEKHSPPWAS